MTDADGAAPHLATERIQLHYLGRLTRAESHAVHQHIVSCPRCQDQADEVVNLLAIMALERDAEW